MKIKVNSVAVVEVDSAVAIVRAPDVANIDNFTRPVGWRNADDFGQAWNHSNN